MALYHRRTAEKAFLKNLHGRSPDNQLKTLLKNLIDEETGGSFGPKFVFKHIQTLFQQNMTSSMPLVKQITPFIRDLDQRDLLLYLSELILDCMSINDLDGTEHNTECLKYLINASPQSLPYLLSGLPARIKNNPELFHLYLPFFEYLVSKEWTSPLSSDRSEIIHTFLQLDHPDISPLLLRLIKYLDRSVVTVKHILSVTKASELDFLLADSLVVYSKRSGESLCLLLQFSRQIIMLTTIPQGKDKTWGQGRGCPIPSLGMLHWIRAYSVEKKQVKH